MIFSAGTRTSSNVRIVVSEECIPILEIADLDIPGVSMGTMISDLFLCAGPSLVLARRQDQSDCRPLVIQILVPLITRSSPALLALVVMLATSDPPPGSLYRL